MRTKHGRKKFTPTTSASARPHPSAPPPPLPRPPRQTQIQDEEASPPSILPSPPHTPPHTTPRKCVRFILPSPHSLKKTKKKPKKTPRQLRKKRLIRPKNYSTRLYKRDPSHHPSYNPNFQGVFPPINIKKPLHPHQKGWRLCQGVHACYLFFPAFYFGSKHARGNTWNSLCLFCRKASRGIKTPGRVVKSEKRKVDKEEKEKERRLWDLWDREEKERGRRRRVLPRVKWMNGVEHGNVFLSLFFERDGVDVRIAGEMLGVVRQECGMLRIIRTGGRVYMERLGSMCGEMKHPSKAITKVLDLLWNSCRGGRDSGFEEHFEEKEIIRLWKMADLLGCWRIKNMMTCKILTLRNTMGELDLGLMMRIFRHGKSRVSGQGELYGLRRWLIDYLVSQNSKLTAYELRQLLFSSRPLPPYELLKALEKGRDKWVDGTRACGHQTVIVDGICRCSACEMSLVGQYQDQRWTEYYHERSGDQMDWSYGLLEAMEKLRMKNMEQDWGVTF